jgi:septal ring factor EnvC (AmiA/AmiB activator)
MLSILPVLSHRVTCTPAACCLPPLQCHSQHTHERATLQKTIQDLTEKEATLKALLEQMQQELCEHEAKHMRLMCQHNELQHSYEQLSAQLRAEQVSLTCAGKQGYNHSC